MADENQNDQNEDNQSDQNQNDQDNGDQNQGADDQNNDDKRKTALGGEENNDDKAASSYRERVSAFEDEATRKEAERYNSDADLAKALVETKKALSQRIKVPGKDATDEEVAAYRKATGVPEDEKGYKVEKPEHLADEEWKDEKIQGNVSEFTKAMHAAGANQAVVEAALGTYWKMEKAARETIAKKDKETAEAAEAALRKEWGKDYEQNEQFAEAFVRKQGGAELLNLELRDGTLLGSYPAFIKMAATIGRRTSEGALQTGLAGTEAGTDLQKQFDELTTQIADAHAAGDSEKAQRLSAERREINKKLHGGD